MSIIDSRKIWEDVKNNRRLLDSCDLHDFSVDITPDRAWGKKWQCTKCKGTVDSTEKVAYEKGVAHGKNITV